MPLLKEKAHNLQTGSFRLNYSWELQITQRVRLPFPTSQRDCELSSSLKPQLDKGGQWSWADAGTGGPGVGQFGVIMIEAEIQK